MKKIITISLFLCLSLGLCACSLPNKKVESETPDYETQIKSAINNYFATGAADGFQQGSILDYSSDTLELDNYVKKLFKTFSCSQVKSVSGDSYEATLSIPKLEELAAVAANDTSGFVSDLKNMNSLGETEEDESKYVCSYLCNTIDQVSKTEVTVSIPCTVSGDSVKVTGSFLEGYYNQYVNQLISQLVAFAINGTEMSFDVAVSSSEKSVLQKGKGMLLNYYSGDKAYKLFVTLVDVLWDNDAVAKVKEINSANAGFSPGTNSVCYLEYKVHNLEDEDVVLDNPFKFIDSDNNVYTYSGMKFVGVNATQKVASGDTKTMSAVFIGNGKDMSLGWYDSINKLFVAVVE